MKKYNDSLFIAALAASCFISAGCGDNSSLAEKGENALAKGDYTKAASLFNEASIENPSSPALKYNEGAALSKQGDSASASKAFEEALKINPDDFDSAEYLAVELEKAGNFDEAHRLMDKVLAGRTNDKTAFARALNTMAKIEIGINRPDLAIIRLFAARDRDQNYAPTYFNLAKIYGETFGLYSTAAGYLEKFMQLSISNPGEKDKAEKLLQSYLQIPSRPQTTADRPSENPESPFNKGRLSYSKGKFAEAEQYFAKAEQEKPNSYFASFFRAHALFAAKKFKEAEAAYKTASEKATTESEPVYWMGVAASYAKDFNLALSIFTGKLMPGWPDDIRPYLKAAEIFDKLGQDESAKKGNSDPYFYSSRVFAERCVEIANAQGKPAQDAELLLKKLSDKKFDTISFAGTEIQFH